jgi:antitoxin ParD1/3/4
MNVNLTPNLELFVRELAASGDYNNASEVVREALRLLRRVEEQRALKLERLRAAIREGDEALERGDYIVLSTDEEMDAFFAKI